MTTASRHSLERPDGEAARWGWCFAFVATLHVLSLVLLGLSLRPAIMAAAAPPPSVMVDMAPLPAPPSPPQVAPRPQPRRAEVPRPSEIVTLPKLPSVATAAVAVPPEPEKPAPPAPSPVVAPPPAALPPSKAIPTWQGLVLGQLERFKRYPSDAQFHRQQGVVWLRFTMSRDGKVLSAGVDKGSGYDALDAEALALVKRAQPLPKPPPEVAGDRLELVAPVEFFLKGRR
ncbi:MAG TPA: TonB family protein [Caulobacteraceae bacterium]|nr:TonB family protein [Caulobacteraceae bacterium]